MNILKSIVGGVIAAGLAAASGIGQSAQAQQAPPPARTVAVHYGDLDLGSPAGRDTLTLRIRHAVRAACGAASPADLEGQNVAADCRRDLHASLAGQREAAIAAARPSDASAVLRARR